MQTVFFAAGWLLGIGYVLYAFALSVGCVGPHLAWLLVYAFLVVRRGPHSRVFRLVTELTYCLVNPLAYLLVFQPGLFAEASPRWLVTLEWALLCSYWLLRTLGAPWRPSRVVLHGVLLVCVAVLCAIPVRDAAIFLTLGSDLNTGDLTCLFVAPLYVLPLIVTFVGLRQSRDERAWSCEPLTVGAGLGRRGLAGVLIASVMVIVVTGWRPSPETTRARLVANQGAIIRAAERHRLDPRLLASIVYVTHREHTTPFREELETAFASAWLVDSSSHTMLSERINPSLGLAQVKPVTVQTALTILARSRGGRWLPSKEYRDVTDQGDAWERIPAPGLISGVGPAPEGAPSRAQLVSALLDPEQNVELAALILDVLAAQWELAQPALRIRERPDILATLYQLGFERSKPKPDPKANDFGRDVAAECDSSWMQEHFGTPRP